MSEPLPVTSALPELEALLAKGRNAVLVAPPGAGKTTLVPLALRNAPWLAGSKITMLEPRRLATRAAATRMASLVGEAVGNTIGYRTRLDSAVSAATRIEVVTEGLLIRRLLSDPGLEGVGLVILDEVHERALEADLALALCLDLQLQLRPELRLLAMSATADGARLSALMNAEVVQSEGRMYPVEVRHSKRDISDPRDLPDVVSRAVREALADHDGDILAFLPGMGEIRRTEAALAGCGAMVLPLHGDLPVAAQDLALKQGDRRRVVLATSIAETSITVPGVRIVIDGGFRRSPRLDAATGLTRLATLRISRAAADQRAGRAGREAPGIAIRLWSTALHRGLPAFDRPEILEAELSGLVLDCAAWGTAVNALPFPDMPPQGAITAATTLLTELGAIESGRLTTLGQRMARLGAHPRLAAMMLAAESDAEMSLAADIAAILEERDPMRAPDASADIGLRITMVETGQANVIRRAAQQYKNRLRTRAISDGDPGKLIAAGFPDRIAQRRGEPGSFRLSGGGGARLPTADPLAKAPLLAVASLEMKQGARIRLAAALAFENLPAVLSARITEAVETGVDPVSGSVLARRRTRLGALILEDRTEPASPEETAAALARATKPEALPWTDTARQFQARVALISSLESGWPDLSDAALAVTMETWLAPYLLGATRLADLAKLELTKILRSQLSWEQANRLDRELPTHLSLPKARAAIDYTQPVPVAEARAQVFYGVSGTPMLANGRISLRLALLSPAMRPIAITSDLAGFWRGAWAEVRKDMRGRYPRHDWPEHPDQQRDGVQ